MNEHNLAVEVRISGIVQGVGFRYWAWSVANELGVHGWVRNDPDGDVLAHLEGPEPAIATMLKRLHNGPRFARVTQFETVEGTFRGLRDFSMQ